METIDIWGVDEGIEKVIIHGVSLISSCSLHALNSSSTGIRAYLSLVLVENSYKFGSYFLISQCYVGREDNPSFSKY
jgi:hypothetical protein